ncbi:BnaC06g25180D [Brassica napus]|uniref:BnaC06g25180D protein n=1 Tax=Brassica napus TaxID=3708 RepID=A0A078GE18_BRANA|nr:BnaC06g25180D [Brassica napus]
MTKRKAKKKPTATPEPDSPQDASARPCPVSTKLIHSFLTRQLICLPKNMLWSVFGGNPLRYGLQEFWTVTGLNCASFPEGYHPDTVKPVVAGKDEVWKRQFGKKTMVTIAELCLMLEEDKKMDHWKKIRIALIIIVDGVLIAHKQQARAIPRYVKMLKNLKTFFAFPWGRESFVKTISCMKPPKPSFKNGNDPVSWLLLSFIPAQPDQRTLMDLEDGYLPQHKSIDSISIRRVEFSSDSGWGEWPNDPKDDCVIYMEQLIADQFTFNKGMWPAGVTTEPLLNKPIARVHRKGMFPTRVKQSLKPKKVIKKETSSRKQRRISSKKPATSHQARHEASIHQDAPDTSHHQHQPDQAQPLYDDHPTDQDVDAMETDEQPSSQSPIISHSPGRVETIHTPTVHGLFDHNHTTVHTSPDHNSDSEMIPPDENTTNTIPEDDIQTTPAPEEPNQPIVPPHPHRHLSNRPEPKSVIYDKSDHPNSPEIHHILCYGLRIYDPISPDPPLSNPPIFDSTIGPSSAPYILLRLSPLPFTPLTSPAKSNDSGLGFLSHTATHNDFAATASTSPPVIGRPTIVPSPADESQGDDEAVIDLTQTKDPPRHVLSMEENHLAKELFSCPLVPAIALISPLPQMEWDLFEKILKANINVYHTTHFEFEFSNKSLLQLGEPKQWTTTYKILKQIRKHELFLLFLTIQHKESNCWHPNYLLVWIEADYIRGSDEGESLPKVLPMQIRRTWTNNNSTIATEDTLQSPNQPSDANNSRAQLINIAVAAIAVGTMAWIYAKNTN